MFIIFFNVGCFFEFNCFGIVFMFEGVVIVVSDVFVVFCVKGLCDGVLCDDVC